MTDWFSIARSISPPTRAPCSEGGVAVTKPHRLLDEWLRMGRPEPTPVLVERHLEQCRACRTFLEREDKLADIMGCHTDPLTPARHRSMRYRLQRAARAARPRTRVLFFFRW